jgi:hypothetical protein
MRDIGSKANKWMALLVVIILALTYARQPLFFLSPRIWGEEGSVYLQEALEGSFLETFFQQHFGYYSLANNLTAEIVARSIPLEYAAHFTTLTSALIQIVTSLVIYTTCGSFVNGRLNRYLLSISPFLFSTPEVWLNSINLQFWLATGTFFILNSCKVNILHIGYLFASFMTGVSSLFFYPFFLIRAIFSKTKSNILIVTGGLICALLQVLAFRDYLLFSEPVSRFRPEYLNNIVRGIISTTIPFDKRAFVMAILFVALLIVTFTNYIRKHIENQHYYEIALSILSLIFYTLLTIFASLEMGGGGRYGLPVYCGLFAIMLSGNASITDKKYRRFCTGAIAILLSFKAVTFFQTEDFYSTEWPSWQSQVRGRTCLRDKDILLFPRWQGTDWRMTIPAHSGISCKVK